jgi:hypothetical protein
VSRRRTRSVWRSDTKSRTRSFSLLQPDSNWTLLEQEGAPAKAHQQGCTHPQVLIGRSLVYSVAYSVACVWPRQPG